MDRRAVQLLRRPRPAKLARCPELREVVQSKLELHGSPQQIAAWLRISYPGNPEMQVSHETIYLSLVIALMIPFFIAMAIVWTLFFIAWYLIGIPFGTGT